MKRFWKNYLSMFLAFVVVVAAIPVSFHAKADGAVTFTAEADGKTLREVQGKQTSIPLEDLWSGETVTVPVKTIEIAKSVETVELSFSENVLAYNYDDEGEWLAGDYEDYMTGADQATVEVDSDGDAKPDYIYVQTPYDEEWNTTILYVIMFQYEIPVISYEASVDGKELTDIRTEKNSYDYLPYGEDPVTVDTDIIKIPADTEEVTLKFSDNVLVYNYDGEGGYLAGWVEDYMTGSKEITVKVDSDKDNPDHENLGIDYIQVQTPYDEMWRSDLLYAITFEYEENESEETTPEETTPEETTPEETTPEETDPSMGEVDQEVLEDIYQKTGDVINGLFEDAPVAGAEWYLLGLMRAGYEVAPAVVDEYYDSLVEKLEDKEGDLGQATTYARTVMALTAAGKDVADVAGYNLLEAFSDFDFVKSQGLNGVAYSLIALDCGKYDIPALKTRATANSRERMVEEILKAQLADGGWAYFGTVGDPDMTAIAMEALAPYMDDEEVADAIDKALELISQIQDEDGAYSSWGTSNSDSTAQIVIALSTVGIDPATDARFAKNGNAVLKAMCDKFYVRGGGFGYDDNTNINNYSSLECYDALTAYYRMKDGNKDLYDMTDVKKDEPEETPAESPEETTGSEETKPSEETDPSEEAKPSEESSLETSTEITESPAETITPSTTEKPATDSTEKGNGVDTGDHNAFGAITMWFVLFAVGAFGAVALRRRNRS